MLPECILFRKSIIRFLTGGLSCFLSLQLSLPIYCSMIERMLLGISSKASIE